MGFGHRVYKNHDPRAIVMRKTCHELLEHLNMKNDPLFALAMSLEKTALTAADMLNDKVIPWYTEQDIPLLRVLTDRGTEYCGKVESHAYQLYLALENVDHSKTKARHPQTNGIVERFHRTMKQEFYDIAFRKKIYSNLDELQVDLDAWLSSYNNLRPHSGRYCCGNTPMQTFKDSKHIAIDKNIGNMLRISDNQTYLALTV
jgi:transposase InsO family protein